MHAVSEREVNKAANRVEGRGEWLKAVKQAEAIEDVESTTNIWICRKVQQSKGYSCLAAANVDQVNSREYDVSGCIEDPVVG